MYEQTAISPGRLWFGRIVQIGGVLCLLYVGYWLFLRYKTDLEYSETIIETPVMTPTPPPSKREASTPEAPKKAPLPTGEFIGRVEFAGKNSVVLEGVDDHTLKLAVGHVPGTALPGESGRIALAAHRDTFFRPLRDVKVGNRISVTTPKGKFEYLVTKTEIVKPDAMHVLSPTKVDTLTLITCYPFNFIGKAPMRYIVHARAAQTGA